MEVGAGICRRAGAAQVHVQGIGLRTEVEFAAGNAGPIGIGLGFKPPNGVGLEVDAGGFTGGGFLILDPDKGEYAGGLELTFAGIDLASRAIGILSTRTAGRQRGLLAADHHRRRSSRRSSWRSASR